jgi:hypothetical protein
MNRLFIRNEAKYRLLRARLVKIVSSAQAALVRVRVIGKWR